jgi:hypothetical protein
MASFTFLPAEQDVFVIWSEKGPTLNDIRLMMMCAPEIGEYSVVELYQQAKGKPEFHVGRFDLLRAMEIRRLCEERGLTARLN